MQKIAPEPSQANCFGEVIQTDIATVVVQIWPQATAGNFGEIIKIFCPWGTAYAIVVGIKTTPILGHLQPTALQLNPTELALEQPQLNDVVANFINASVLGYKKAAAPEFIFNYLPQPAPLHAFTTSLSNEELSLLTQHSLFWPHFLQLIQPTGIAEQLVKALVFTLAEQRKLSVDFFEKLYNDLGQTPGFTQQQMRQLFREFNHLVKQNS